MRGAMEEAPLSLSVSGLDRARCFFALLLLLLLLFVSSQLSLAPSSLGGRSDARGVLAPSLRRGTSLPFRTLRGSCLGSSRELSWRVV